MNPPFVLLVILLISISRLDGLAERIIGLQPPLELQLEHAVTEEAIRWGFMERRELPWGHGMTFNFPVSHVWSFWMYNTYLDLSLAFLSEDRVIRAFHELKAHPDQMEPKNRKKAVQFFRQQMVKSPKNTRYAIEMGKGWFPTNGISIGDVMIWTTEDPRGLLLRTMDLAEYTLKNKEPLLLIFEEEQPASVWHPRGQEPLQLTFFDKNGKVVKKGTLPASRQIPYIKKTVFYTTEPAKSLLIEQQFLQQ